jgi:hypothetical protein
MAISHKKMNEIKDIIQNSIKDITTEDKINELFDNIAISLKYDKNRGTYKPEHYEKYTKKYYEKNREAINKKKLDYVHKKKLLNQQNLITPNIDV